MNLLVQRATVGPLDAHRNPTTVWSSARPWSVRGIAPGASVEPTLPNRDAAVVEWTVYADADSSVPSGRDKVLLDDGVFEVVATPADWTRGPWAHPSAGVVVELKRWEG